MTATQQTPTDSSKWPIYAINGQGFGDSREGCHIMNIYVCSYDE